jgi:protein YIPF1/2
MRTCFGFLLRSSHGATSAVSSYIFPSSATRLTTVVLNFIFVALGFAASAFFLLRNLYPILSATDHKTSKILLIVVVALHAGFAIAIKVLFFASGSPLAKDKGGGDGVIDGGDKDGKEGERFVRMLFGL